MYRFLLCFLDRAGQVAASDAEFDGDQALALLAVNRRGAGSDEVTLGIGPALFVVRRDEVAQRPLRIGRQVVQGAVPDTAVQTRHRQAGAEARHADAAAREPRRRHAGQKARSLIVGDVHRDFQDSVLARTQSFRPAQRDVELLLALDHRRNRLAAHRRFDDRQHVVVARPVGLALVAIDGELQVRLALDAEDAHVLDAVDVFQDDLQSIRQPLQFVEVGSDDLDRVVALNAGQRFHDVVADVLREVPIDADDFLI